MDGVGEGETMGREVSSKVVDLALARAKAAAEADAMRLLREAMMAYAGVVGIDPDNLAGTLLFREEDLARRSDDLGRIYGSPEVIAAGERVIECCDRVIECNPDLGLVHSTRGGFLFGTGRFDEALASCQRAIDLNSKDFDAHLLRLGAFFFSGRFVEVIASCDEMIALDPTWAASGERIRARALSEIQRNNEIVTPKGHENNNAIADQDSEQYTSNDLSRTDANLSGTTMDEATAFELVAAKRGLSVAQLDEAIDNYKAAKAEVGARKTTRRAMAKPRPKAKPRAKWEARKGVDLKLSPPKFIAKHYSVEMASGTLHRGVIRNEDPALHVKLRNWLRTHDMPEGVDIPTLPEWNTRRLAEKPDEDAATREAIRLHGTAKMRELRAARAERPVARRGSRTDRKPAVA
jgi:hypothetical protein